MRTLLSFQEIFISFLRVLQLKCSLIRTDPIREVPRSMATCINRVAPIQGDLMDIDVSTRFGTGVHVAWLTPTCPQDIPTMTFHGSLVSPWRDTPGSRTSRTTFPSVSVSLSRDARVFDLSTLLRRWPPDYFVCGFHLQTNGFSEIFLLFV